MSVASAYEWQMLALINAERAAVGADPLKLELILNSAAEDHSDWMLATDTFSHTGIGGSSAGQRMTAAGFDLSGNWTWGENLAGRTISSPEGYADEIVELHQQLMNSPGHRENLLNPDFEYVGIGLEVGEYKGSTWAMVTQKFARTASDVAPDIANLASHEVQNNYDFNGDGTIGQLVADLDTNGIGLQTNISGKYAIVDGNETHVVTLQGAETSSDSYAGWQAIQAGSDGAGGYSVLWMHNGGTYGVWNLDGTGAQYAFPDMSDLIEFEARFAFDINGDGGIGHFATDLDTNGIGLQSNTRGVYSITDGDETLVVTYQGAVAGPDSYAGWEAIQAGSDGADGYSLLWQHASGVYGVWNLDSAGAQYEFADASNLVDLEDQFAFDINKDGAIGHVSTDLDTNGIGLQSSTRGTYSITDGDETFVVTYQGAVAGPDSYVGWEAIQAGSDGAGGYSLLWQHASGVYGVWNLDSTGAQYEFPNTSNLADYEDRFAYDITGDDILG